MAINWDMNTWVYGTFESRLEAAKKERDAGNIVPFKSKGVGLSGFNYFCNICRTDQKNDVPHAVYDEGYSCRYYCHSCSAHLGLSW